MREYKKRYDEWMRNPYFDKETKEEEYLTLPQEVEGKKIHWSYPLNFRAVEILFLGFLSATLFYFSEK